MEIRLTKDWKRRHGVIKKGTVVEVTASMAQYLINNKIGKPVRDNFFKKVFQKSAEDDDSTKQTARKIKKKDEKD